ncbi:pentatricopeptide repeat-containing protein [Citrus sinensis]|nr:pentatricopeptide repeat-containing protein [Citrus sinensis]
MLNSRHSILGIGLKTKNVKNSRSFMLRKLRCGTISAMSDEKSDKRLVGGGVLEKEFEFKPSFSEYLKDMETWKSGQLRKQDHKSNRYNSKDSSRENNGLRTSSSRRDDTIIKVRKFEGYSNKEMITRVVKHQELCGNGNGVTQHEEAVRGKFDRKGSVIRKSTQDHRLNRYMSKDGSRGKDVWTPSSGRDDANVKLQKFEGYSNKKFLSRVLEHQELCGNDNGVTQPEEAVRGKFDRTGSATRKSNGKLNSKECLVDMKVKGNFRRETMGERQLHYQSIGVESELNNSHPEKVKKFQNARNSSMILVNNKKNGITVYPRGELLHDRDSPKMIQTKGKSFEKREVGDRNHESLGGENVTDLIKISKNTHEEIERKSRRLTSGSKSFLEEGDDDSWGEERAAFKTFEEGNDIMDKRRVSRMEMEERIQKLARQLNGADINLPEWIFSKMMRSAQIRYSDHCILRVIQILGKLGNWRRVLQVIEWLQMRERFKSYRLRYIYTTALYVLGKARRPVEALNVFLTMQQQMSSYPDTVAYRSIAVTLGQAGHIKELFDVIDSMRSLPKKKFKTGTLERWDPRLEPDIVVYNAVSSTLFVIIYIGETVQVLNACVRRKQWEGAFWVLQQLKQQGQKPSATTYGLVMEVMLACGKYNLVYEFFRKVQKSYIPNALAYKVLVNTLWREGKTDEAVSAVEDMERRGIVGSAALYYDLARCLCSAGKCEEALMQRQVILFFLQMDKICKVANKPLVVSYTGLIQACLDSGNIQNAAYIFNQMKNFCSPNLVTCNIMVKAYLEHGLFEEAMKLFQEMAEDSNHINREYDKKGLVIPDIYTFNTMLDACAAEKRWDDLELVYKRMLHHGLHFNAKRHLRMILDASRAGKVELLEITWEHLARADRITPPALIKERFCNRLENKDYGSAISCLVSHPVSGSPEFSRNAWLKFFKENSQHFGQDTLIQLLHEASSSLTTRNGSPYPVLQNLISSCKDFLRTQSPAPVVNLTGTPLYSSI